MLEIQNAFHLYCSRLYIAGDWRKYNVNSLSIRVQAKFGREVAFPEKKQN